MSSLQRKRGTKAIVYSQKMVDDNRGNHVLGVDMDNGVEVVGAFIPQRSARAEVPGQAVINVTRMIVKHDIPGVDVGLWSRVFWNDRYWDVVTPPAYHHGTRHTRHWSIDLRERP